MPTLKKYLKQIENNDPNLTEINLSSANLGDDGVKRLMLALENSPETAARITKLYLNNNKLNSINIPATLTALEELSLSRNHLRSINIPATLTALRMLRINRNYLTSLDIPKALINLKFLFLAINDLNSVNIPETLTSLCELDLTTNNLTSINISKKLTALQCLWLGHNPLKDINVPEKFTVLQTMGITPDELNGINTLPARLPALPHIDPDNNLTILPQLAIRDHLEFEIVPAKTVEQIVSHDRYDIVKAIFTEIAKENSEKTVRHCYDEKTQNESCVLYDKYKVMADAKIKPLVRCQKPLNTTDPCTIQIPMPVVDEFMRSMSEKLKKKKLVFQVSYCPSAEALEQLINSAAKITIKPEARTDLIQRYTPPKDTQSNLDMLNHLLDKFDQHNAPHTRKIKSKL